MGVTGKQNKHMRSKRDSSPRKYGNKHLKDGNFSYPEISVKIVRKLAKRAGRKMIDQSNLPRNNMVERR